MMHVLGRSYHHRAIDLVQLKRGSHRDLETRRGPPFCCEEASVEGLWTEDQCLLGLAFARFHDLLLQEATPRLLC